MRSPRRRLRDPVRDGCRLDVLALHRLALRETCTLHCVVIDDTVNVRLGVQIRLYSSSVLVVVSIGHLDSKSRLSAQYM